MFYCPNEDSKVEEKDEFLEQVSIITDDSKNKLIIMGDLNDRVGTKDVKSGEVLGAYGETSRNSNGKRIIDYCIQNDLLLMNTWFEHKNIHKYTRVAPTRNERSIISTIS